MRDRIEALRELRRRQALRVANASRGKRPHELALYELVDAALEGAIWEERMRQQVLPCDLSGHRAA